MFEVGTARTVRGTLAPSDPWARTYARANPVDTDGGLRPQNLFRLVTRETGTSFRQRVSARILATNLTQSPERGRFSGLFLDSRFLDEGNVYVAGVQFDGRAVIKKRRGEGIHTLAITRLYPGSYDRERNPNLLPRDRWFSIRSTIEDVPSGVRILLEVHDPELGPDSIPVLEVVDGPGGADGPPITSPGHAGVRSDFMDVEFEEYLAFEPPDVLPDRPGVRDGETGAVLLGVVPTPGAPPQGFTLGGEGTVLPVAGRWTVASCADGVALYDPVTSVFALPIGASATDEPLTFAYGPPDASLRPVAGDWDGDGIDGVGLYDPASGTFFLTNRLGPGPADATFVFGSGGHRFLPIAGDWDGDGRDGVGIYDVERGFFFLKNALGGGVADTFFRFGPSGGAPADRGGLDRNGGRCDRPLPSGRCDLRGGLRAVSGFRGRVEQLGGSLAAATPLAGRWEDSCR